VRERTFGPYRIERRLATGGMAEVFLAHRQGPHGWSKRVALKCILPQLARDPEFTSMFIDEARLAARLEHPGIVPVFDFGEHRSPGELSGTLFLAMEYVDGASIARLLRAVSARNEMVPLSAAVHVGIETARALAYAHHLRDERGGRLEVVHRDVSPANILVSRRGQPKLGDFGIARFAEAAHRTDEGHVRGKLGYMSPEQVSGGAIDGKTDVFTLATVLAELLIGVPLFGSGTDLDILLRIRNADISTLRAAPRTIPTDLVRVLMDALQKRPEARPDAATFAESLERLARRRGLIGEGSLVLARTLYRLDLVSAAAEDRDAREPGARPTSLVDTGDVPKLKSSVPPAQRPGTEELIAKLALEPTPSWEVKLEDGRLLGPLAFPVLVQKILAGDIPPTASLRKDDGTFSLASQVPELSRYLGSHALVFKPGAFDPGELERATSSGHLSDGSLLSLVCRLGKERATGLLSLRGAHDDRKKKVYFVDGRPDFVSSNDPTELLGEHLVRSGACMRMEVDMALAMLPKYGGRLGDALVRLGILTPSELYAAIESQVRARYLEAFRWKAGAWCYVPGARAGEQTVPMREGVPDLLREAAETADLAVVTGALRPLRDKTLLPGISPPFPLSVYGARPLWRQVVGQASGNTVSRAVALHTQGGSRDPDEVYRAIWFGLSTELLRAA
jgi:serine/threonine-protein kinase